MSIIFGVLHGEGDVVPERKLLDLARPTHRWAPDGTFVRAMGPVGMGVQPYHTHERSNLESGPAVDRCGNMVVVDGRLDNHTQLCELLDMQDPSTADSQIILAAFRRWGEDSFAKLVGDWALALWDQSNRSLYLARDHAGTRSLYCGERNGHFLWSTFLETFFAQGESYSLDETYAACYLACQPTSNRTPYRGIGAVPPAHYVVADGQRMRRKAYWSPTAGKTISYGTDTDYEEHFLALFRQAVKRRCGAGAPMLIHLSGGMDSSSIVCMADEIERERCPTNPSLVDTLSYFDGSEPDWDEEPFVAVVESHRRRKGIHLELSLSARTFTAPSASGASYLLPGLDSSSLSWERKVFSVVEPKGVRVFVTGNGGDEVLGGVPTPLPELADYVVAGKFGLLFAQAKRWCLANRSALLPMAKATASYLVDLYWRTDWECATVPPWVDGSRIRTSAKERRTQVFSEIAHVRPSEIENERTWLRVLECLPHLQPGVMNRYEYRYPYLDRDLVEFLFSVPREQLVRPGRRRSLMRRSLEDIVPQKILERKRKAFCARGPLIAVRRAGEMQKSLLTESKAAALGIADKRAIEVALQQVASGDGIEQIGALMRLLSFESWVRSQVEGGILRLPTETTADYCLSSRQ